MEVGRPDKRNIVVQYVLEHPHEYNKAKIARELCISRQTVYQYWDEARASLPKHHRIRQRKRKIVEKKSPEQKLKLCDDDTLYPCVNYEEDDIDYVDGQYYVNDEGDVLPF